MAVSDCQMIFDTLYEGVIMVDMDRKITYWNLGAKRLTGFSSDETIGTMCHDDILNHIDVHGRMLCLDGCPFRQSMIDGKVREMEIYLQHKRGHRIPVRLRTVPIVEEGKIVGSIEMFIESTQVTDRFKRIGAHGNQILVDPLTHLPNRTMIEHFLETKLNDYNKFGIPFGIAIVDLDNFEAINLTYGLSIGDEVLKLLSESFRHCFKSADIIGRWENDAFIFGFANLSKEALTTICDKIRVVSEGTVLRNMPAKDIDFSASVGGTLIRQEEDLENLLERVHAYLKKAKIKGGNSCVVK
jgi:diguanylate cyclase (GGDEF)-like protein/PAS domain S-box-containing protein